MQSESQSHVLKTTESLVLDCDFHAEHFNLFDYPVLWRKSQAGKLTDNTAINAKESNNIIVRHMWLKIGPYRVQSRFDHFLA